MSQNINDLIQQLINTSPAIKKQFADNPEGKEAFIEQVQNLPQEGKVEILQKLLQEKNIALENYEEALQEAWETIKKEELTA